MARSLKQQIVIIPIVAPNINWPSFVSQTNNLVGRSPTRSLDAAGLPVGDQFSFIASLAEFQYAASEPWGSVKFSDRILRTLHYAFLCESPIGNIIRRSTDLDIITPEGYDDVFIVSGNLEAFRNAIVSCKDPQIRPFMNALYGVFNKAGLIQIFKRWKITNNSDGTFSFTS